MTCKLPAAGPDFCDLKCNQGICKFIDGQPKCKCPLEYDGKYCEHFRCSGYCKNRGECYVDPSVNKNHTKGVLQCKCHPPWTGDRCDIPVSMCERVCHNGAKCTATTTPDEIGDCICQRNFTGRYCQNCEDLECENHGICKKDGDGNSYCECSKLYTGQRCERSICEGYCNAHGQCTVHLENKPKCFCEDGYYGSQCQNDACTDYCQNGGTCTLGVHGTTRCTCPPNYFGARCEDHKCDLQECDHTETCEQVNCRNGGTCHILHNEPICNCTLEWAGNVCDTRVDSENPCKDYCENNGICKLEDMTVPKCYCAGEWTGDKCNMPPSCIETCGVCTPGSSINECL